MTAPLAREIGQTENALRGILTAIIADSPFTTYPQYITMMMASQPGSLDNDALIRQLAAATKISPEQAGGVVNDLVASGQLTRNADTITLSEDGETSFGAVRARVGEVSARIHANISEYDAEATRRTLGTLLDAANRELAMLNA
jgi:DNA-binding MarR family transcriptional regulator